ncbi:hypothetical protein AB0I69_46995 [Streptomyces sp. NPDC050508]|uniref:hypothetical protein n=1 Tax=Streptomyces sp. NPDC050508 TaxID=3155405 RepID=UPI003419F3F3
MVPEVRGVRRWLGAPPRARDAGGVVALRVRWRPWSGSAVSVPSFFLLGGAVRDALDPKLR